MSCSPLQSCLGSDLEGFSPSQALSQSRLGREMNRNLLSTGKRHLGEPH